LDLPAAMMVPKAAVNFTMSRGVRLSPGVPPMVPLIPEILFISANTFGLWFGRQKYVKRNYALPVDQF